MRMVVVYLYLSLIFIFALGSISCHDNEVNTPTITPTSTPLPTVSDSNLEWPEYFEADIIAPLLSSSNEFTAFYEQEGYEISKSVHWVLDTASQLPAGTFLTTIMDVDDRLDGEKVPMDHNIFRIRSEYLEEKNKAKLLKLAKEKFDIC